MANNFSKFIRIREDTKAVRNGGLSPITGKYTVSIFNNVISLCEQKISTVFNCGKFYSFTKELTDDLYNFDPNVGCGGSIVPTPTPTPGGPTPTPTPTPTATPVGPTPTPTRTPTPTPTSTPTPTPTPTATPTGFNTSLTTVLGGNPSLPTLYYVEGPIGMVITSLEAITFNYNNLGVSGPPLSMDLFIGASQIAAVTASSDYAGLTFSVTVISTGITYSGIFANGTVNL